MKRTIPLALVAAAFGCQRAEELPPPAPGPLVVWLDVDPAVMRGGHEPDDGLALLQAFHSKELEIRGVSVVFGNSPLETGFPIAQEIVRRFGPAGLEVFAGASSGADLGVETDASRALADALRRESLTILALGPVTNVATVLTNHPELSSNVEEVVAVAGRRPGQTFTLGEGGTPLMDFNFELDPAGFQVLLDSSVPLALAPFEISAKTPLSEEDVEAFARAPEIANFFLEPLRDYVNWYEERFQIRAIYPFDTLAVAYLTSPDWIACDDLPIAIETRDDDVKPGEEKPYLLVSRDFAGTSRALYCHTADGAFLPDLMSRMLGSPETPSVLFLCPHGAAKSVMAAAYFEEAAREIGLTVRIDSAGTDPDETVSAAVAERLKQDGVDVSSVKPRMVTAEDVEGADYVVSLGCDVEAIPAGTAELRRWDEVPPPSQGMEASRDAIRKRVAELANELKSRK
jgi:pyrimidine-specific ribonucleoside hydrolase